MTAWASGDVIVAVVGAEGKSARSDAEGGARAVAEGWDFLDKEDAREREKGLEG